jgi:hypothetical protein
MDDSFLSCARTAGAGIHAGAQLAERGQFFLRRHPACPGLSDGIVRGAQQEGNLGWIARHVPFTRLERRKSLIERWRLVSCCGAQVKKVRRLPTFRTDC